ncbi:hypothetical protein [Terribacillus sp. DMT04]|uniref:hypothetical protein n=1 Tax=Terribacillus sp. DMT04 TaxID=2850441 RepID=UPI001C2C68AC|nr:hypothetical protein [Terribacillus sp. DMT04]QXE00524.1 hypothetical protein KS242_10860 [Terribacillus sp. DMT04]
MRSSEAQNRVFGTVGLDGKQQRQDPSSLSSDPYIPAFGGAADTLERKKLQEQLKQS